MLKEVVAGGFSGDSECRRLPKICKSPQWEAGGDNLGQRGYARDAP
jgi:hypothetical protein